MGPRNAEGQFISDVLKWLGEHFQYGKAEEASLLWGALTRLFFLLRASEYLEVGYVDVKRGLRGGDIIFKKVRKPCDLSTVEEVDEITVLVRGSKTDVYNRWEMRNHFRAAEKICVVKAIVQLYLHFPQRYQGGDRPIPRAAITACKGAGVTRG